MFTGESQNYSGQQIVGKLHDYYQSRDKAKSLRLEIIQIAVDLGQDKKDATNGSAAMDYLDGYLAGSGIIPPARLTA